MLVSNLFRAVYLIRAAFRPTRSVTNIKHSQDLFHKTSLPKRNMLTPRFTGMLLQALKASQEEKDRPSEKAIGNAKRAIGKKLRLSEY